MESGTKLGHYEIGTLLGKGGMGEVWRARDTKLGREVAIKTLPAEPISGAFLSIAIRNFLRMSFLTTDCRED